MLCFAAADDGDTLCCYVLCQIYMFSLYWTPVLTVLCRQWREEREQLIQCIHLQQLELAQRSVAAHDRAADIAKVGMCASVLVQSSFW